MPDRILSYSTTGWDPVTGEHCMNSTLVKIAESCLQALGLPTLPSLKTFSSNCTDQLINVAIRHCYACMISFGLSSRISQVCLGQS